MSDEQIPAAASAAAPAKKSFAEFLESVPEAPSSSKEAPAEDPPKAGATTKSESPATAGLSAGTPPVESSAAGSAEREAPEWVRKALRDGDLDALADAVGEDPALYSEKSTKWAASRRKEKKLVTERDRVAAQAETIVKRTQPVFDLAGAVQGGDFRKGPELVQYLTGMDYDEFVMKVARARHGSDPQVEVLRKRVAELEPVAAERETARTTAAERAFLETLRDEVAEGHQVRQLGDGWEAKVAAVLRESMDEDLGEPTLSPKQAADRVLRREREAYERQAKVFGGATPTPRGRAAAAPERAAGAAPAGKRKLSREEWLAAQK